MGKSIPGQALSLLINHLTCLKPEYLSCLYPPCFSGRPGPSSHGKPPGSPCQGDLPIVMEFTYSGGLSNFLLYRPLFPCTFLPTIATSYSSTTVWYPSARPGGMSHTGNLPRWTWLPGCGLV